VVGVGGDQVECCDEQGRLTVNGDPVDERAYLRDGVEPSERQFEVDVPEDAIWVMGDNRPNSQDSRFHTQEPGGGTVPDDRVVGRVWAIVWPTDRFELLERPDSLESLAP